MIHYHPGPPNTTFYKLGVFGLSYRELKEDYWRFRRMSNDDFLANLIDILHFTIFVCWVKETGNEVMSDVGVVHELLHLLASETREDALGRLAWIRMDFNDICELA